VTDSTITGRVPPSNLDAEASVLGAILLRNDALDEVCDRGVTIADFYHAAHQLVFEAMIDLHVEREPIDVLTVAERVKALPSGRRGAISETLLAELAARVPTAANVGHYAAIVHDKAQRRGLIATCAEITGEAFGDVVDTDDLVDKAQERIMAREQAKARIVSAAELVAASTKRLRSTDRRERPIPTGYKDIDAKVGGLLRRRLFVVGGRPKVGKSTFAQGIVDNLTAAGVPVGVVSLEEEGPDYLDAQIGRMAELDSLKVLHGGPFTPSENRAWDNAARVWAKRPLHVCDERRLTMRDVCRIARQMKRQHGIEVLKIDYLGQLRRAGKRKEHEEIEDELSELFACLQALNIAGLLVVQINRGAELVTGRDKRPRIHQLQGAGAIEQWAYCILMIYRECMHNPKADGNIAEILIGGVKRGESNRAVRMLWVSHLPAVRDLPEDYVSPVSEAAAKKVQRSRQGTLPIDGRARAAGDA
jgi:replicative DNA helicase